MTSSRSWLEMRWQRMSKRLVYAEDALANIEREKPYLTDVGYIHAKSAVNSAPTVDAKPVVRCKDCVHMENRFNARFCKVWCMFNGMGDDGFCNYGERRTDNAE